MQVGDKVFCINNEPLKGNDIGPKLIVNQEYTIAEIVKDKADNDHFDVGLKSEYNFVRSYETKEKLPRSEYGQIHWCHPSRFSLRPLLILLIALCFACGRPREHKDPAATTVAKTVKEKKESTETSYSYKLNLLSGKMVLVPDIHTVYYLVYTDGTYDEVDLGKYTITNVGDNVTKTEYH